MIKKSVKIFAGDLNAFKDLLPIIISGTLNVKYQASTCHRQHELQGILTMTDIIGILMDSVE